MRRSLVAVLVLALCQVVMAAAAPLADRIPGDAIVYVGWQGSRALGPAYNASRLKQIADVSDIGQMRDFLQRLAVRVTRDDASAAEVVRLLTPVSDVAWNCPTALYIGPSANPAAGAPPRVALIIDAGTATSAADATAKLQQALGKQGGPVPMVVKNVGSIVAVGIGIDDGMANLLAGRAAGQATLAASADFRAATAQVSNDAAITVFFNIDSLRGQLDRVGGPEWPAWRDAMNLKGVHYLIHTAGFDGKDWSSRGFVSAPAPRQGIASLFDQQPLSDELLRVIPRDATLVLACQFDLARLLKETHDVLGKGNAQAAADFDQALATAAASLGVDLESGLAAALGGQWAMYAAPGVGGSRAMGWVLVNRLRDPAAAETTLTRLEQTLSGAASTALRAGGMQLPAYQIKQGSLTIHYLGTPIISPAWTIRDGVLYMGLYPQVVGAAAEASTTKGGSILDNPAIAAARKTLGKNPAGFKFVDLPATAPDGYGTALLMSRYALGFADMAGVQAPLMAVPPLHKLQPLLTPSLGVCWADDAGFHSRGSEPFPCSVLMAGDFSMGAALQPAILAAIVIPQFSHASGEARQSAVLSTQQSLRSQFELYRLQHEDAYPDLEKYPNWEQLLQQTGPDGVPAPGAKYGPYLASLPVNALNGSSAVQVIKGPVEPGDTAKPGIGWVFDKAQGRLFAVDQTGMIMSDR